MIFARIYGKMICFVALHCEKAFYHDTHGWLGLLFLREMRYTWSSWRALRGVIGFAAFVFEHSFEDVYRVVMR
jgi:hypothetical protein